MFFSLFISLYIFENSRVKVASSQLTALLFSPYGRFCEVTLRVGNSLSLMTIFGRWRRLRTSTI